VELGRNEWAPLFTAVISNVANVSLDHNVDLTVNIPHLKGEPITPELETARLRNDLYCVEWDVKL